MHNIIYDGVVVKFNLVLDGFPQFDALAHVNDEVRNLKDFQQKKEIYKNYLTGTAHLYETMQVQHDSWLDSIQGKVTNTPIVDLISPSIMDDSLNTSGNPNNIVCMLFTQYVSTTLAGGKPWDKESKQ